MSEADDPVAELLARVREASLPPPPERLRLRKASGLSRAEVGSAVDATRAAVERWEKPKEEGGYEPRGEKRTRYARLLRGLAEIHPPAHSDVEPAEPPSNGEPLS